MKILKINILSFLFLFCLIPQAWSAYCNAGDNGGFITPGAGCWIRTDGGTSTQCDGLGNAAYPGSGTGQHCAYNHPAWAIGALGTSGTLAGGETLYVGPGSYLIGATMPNTSSSNCNDGNTASYNCVLDTLPAGTDSTHRTKVYGIGFDDPTNPANVRPKFYGTQRADVLAIASHNDIEFLDITDGSACIENGPIDGNVDGFPVHCQRDTAPYGPWASIGLNAYTVDDAVLRYVNIHGMAKKGVFAYHAGDWLLDHVNIIANGFVGWDSDGTGDDSYTGTITFDTTTIQWSGCGERYPITTLDWASSTDKHHCWSQGQGGFGDAIGLGDGATGNWTFLYSTISHNVSDGVDLLHGSGLGTVIFYRSIAEGNAGNQLKLNATASWVENSKMIGDCGFFYQQSFTSTTSNDTTSGNCATNGGSWDGTKCLKAFDNCRAFGNVIVFANGVNNQQMHITNSTIMSSGDCAMIMEGGATNCNAGTLAKMDNVIVYGGRDAGDDSGLWNTSGGNDTTCLFFNAASGSCSTVQPDIDHSIIYHTKNIGTDTLCSGGTGNQCDVDPKFSGTIKQGCALGGGGCVASDYYQGVNYGEQLYIQSTSPARGAGDETVTCDENCAVDYNNYSRGINWDTGSLQYGSVPNGGGSSSGNNTFTNINLKEIRVQ